MYVIIYDNKQPENYYQTDILFNFGGDQKWSKKK